MGRDRGEKKKWFDSRINKAVGFGTSYTQRHDESYVDCSGIFMLYYNA